MKNSEILEMSFPKSSRLDLSTMHVSCNVFTLDSGLEVRSHYVPLGNYLRAVEMLQMAEIMIVQLEADLQSREQTSQLNKMSKMYNQMEKNTKNNVADEIRELVSKLESKMEEAQILGLSVEISISKLLPKEPMSVVVYEKVTY